MDTLLRRAAPASTRPFLRGLLEVENQKAMDCMIIDIAADGARVALADVPSVGVQGVLAIPARYFEATCRVVQRGKDDTFHLAFTPVLKPTVTIPKP